MPRSSAHRSRCSPTPRRFSAVDRSEVMGIARAQPISRSAGWSAQRYPSISRFRRPIRFSNRGNGRSRAGRRLVIARRRRRRRVVSRRRTLRCRRGPTDRADRAADERTRRGTASTTRQPADRRAGARAQQSAAYRPLAGIVGVGAGGQCQRQSECGCNGCDRTMHDIRNSLSLGRRVMHNNGTLLVSHWPNHHE